MTFLRVASVRALWTWSMSDQGFPAVLTITGVRALTDHETLELSDGAVLFAAGDPANSGPAALCGRLKTGGPF